MIRQRTRNRNNLISNNKTGGEIHRPFLRCSAAESLQPLRWNGGGCQFLCSGDTDGFQRAAVRLRKSVSATNEQSLYRPPIDPCAFHFSYTIKKNPHPLQDADRTNDNNTSLLGIFIQRYLLLLIYVCSKSTCRGICPNNTDSIENILNLNT